MNRLLFSAAVGLASVAGLATTSACAPPTAVSALVQIDQCTEQAAPDDRTRCVIWTNKVDSWGYPAGTEFRGPWWQYEYDRDHSGGELVP